MIKLVKYYAINRLYSNKNLSMRKGYAFACKLPAFWIAFIAYDT